MATQHRVVRGTWQGVTWECFERASKGRELRGREPLRRPAPVFGYEPLEALLETAAASRA